MSEDTFRAEDPTTPHNQRGSEFLAGGGECAALIAARNWSRTSLGSIETWPQSLKTATALLLRSSVPIVMLWGEDGIMIYNDAYSVFAGGRHPELLGSKVREGWPEVADFNDNVMKVGLAGGTLAYRDQELTLFRHGRPEQVWMNLDYSPVLDEAGRPAGVLAIVIETTQRVAAEAALRAERDRARGVLAGMGEGFVLLDRAFRVLEINDEGMRLDERPREAIIGKTHWEVWPNTEDSELGRLYKHAMAAREPVSLDHRYVWPDNRDVWIDVRAYPAGDGLALFYRDVTDRRRSEEALRDTTRRLDAILANTREAVFLMDHRQHCAFANAAAEALTGYSFAEMQGRPLHDVVHHKKPDGSHYPLEECPIDRAFPERALMSGEELFVHKDGSFYHVAFTASPVLDDVGRPVGTVIEARNIEQEKARDAALRESEERFRNMADQAPVMTWVTDANGYCTYLNRRWYEFTGQTAAEAEGFGWLDATHPDDRAQAERIFLDANAKTEPFRIDYRLRRADGAHRWAIDAASPRFGANGEFLGYVGSVIDIDERREMEQALRTSEERYRTLFRSIESGFCVAELTFDGPEGRADYRVVEANPAFYQQTGFPEEILGRWLREAAPALEEHWYETYGRVARTGEPERFEQGSAALGRWFDIYAFRVGEAQDRRVAILFNDISARRNAEERLRELNETLEGQVAERTAERNRIWSLIPDLLMTGSLDGYVTSFNPAWSEVLGHDEATLLSQPFWELIHPDFVSASAEAVRQMKEGRTARHQNQVRTASGDYRWFDWVSTPVADQFYAVARDITETKLREAALEKAQEALRQSQKMEAVGQLTGGIAHDFNNMLAVVIGSLDLLGRRIGTQDARARRYVDAATDGARRAALLTQRLLAFSRQQPLRPELIDVNKLVAGMSDLIRGSLGGDVRFETVLAGGGWRTHADPNQLENVLLNLAVNARDAMPEGGRLTIETQNAHLDARYAAAHLGVPAGQYVLIAITDTGSGMPPEVIAKAFDPFFTTKEVGKGTGLGLSQVYGFVKQSGGHVKIYSELGQGTTVKVYLPRMIGADHDGAEGEAASGVPMGDSREVVLVVEDEPAVRQFSVDALSELGYRVLEADGAPAALRLLDAHPEITLMFTDVVMPEVNGAKLAEEARRRRPDLKVLFTTGYTRNAVVHNGVLDPGVELIGKPFTIEELAAKVREVLDAPAAA